MDSHGLLPETKQKRSFLWIVVVLFILIIASVSAYSIVKLTVENSADTINVDDPDTSYAPAVTSAVETQIAEPEPTEPPQPVQTPNVYVKTAVYVDGEFKVALSSRQAAEELMRNVEEHFKTLDTIPHDAVTVLLNYVKIEPAEPDAEPVDYDTAFAYLTGADTPLTFESRSSFVQYEIAPHNDSVIYTDALPEGCRLVGVYGIDGKTRISYTSIYVNGVSTDLFENERVEVYPAIDGVIYLGSASPSDGAFTSFGETEAFDDGFALSLPAEGELTAAYGYDGNVFRHGIDIAVKSGAPIKAALDGTVVAVMERGAYGLMVEIDHGNGITTRYSALGAAAVSVGSFVRSGSIIGSAVDGSSSPYLHFELRRGCRSCDPLPYFTDIEALVSAPDIDD